MSKASFVWLPVLASVIHCLAKPSADLVVLLVSGRVAAHLGEHGVCAESFDGFHREVHVVGEVAGEVVGAELVFRIETLFREVVRPLGKNGPVLVGEFCVAFDLGDGGDEEEHVAAFLDGHLVALGFLTATIDLAIGEGRCRDRAEQTGTSSARCSSSRGSAQASLS